jgi:hypothetical protein
MTKKALAVFALFLTAAPMMAAQPKINHVPLSCIPADGNGKIIASIDNVSSARVYFHADGEDTEYWVEMLRRGQNQFWAVLPLVCERKAITYRIVARSNGTAGQSQTADVNVPIDDNCAGFKLNGEEQQMAENLVIGWTKATTGNAENDDELQGFRCKGVVQRILVNGEMKRYDGCHDCIAAYIPPQDRIVGLTAASLIGTTIGIIAVPKGGDKTPISPSRP